MTMSFAERIRSEIADRDVNRELRRRITDWLKADEQFNTWFLVTTKRALRDEELMAILDGYRESQEIVEAAWESFHDNRDAAMLIEGMTQSIHRMQLVRTLP
jgi:hypothetical protein